MWLEDPSWRTELRILRPWKERRAYVWQAIWLGGFGAHRFYVGQNFRGWLYAILGMPTLWILSYFAAWIDALSASSASLEEWNRRHNREYFDAAKEALRKQMKAARLAERRRIKAEVVSKAKQSAVALGKPFQAWKTNRKPVLWGLERVAALAQEGGLDHHEYVALRELWIEAGYCDVRMVRHLRQAWRKAGKGRVGMDDYTRLKNEIFAHLGSNLRQGVIA